MKVVVLQSNYIPWKGYFDLIHDADLFIYYDEVKYTKNDWRNRNKIYSKNGLQWLTIPIQKDAVRLKISEVRLLDSHWQEQHFKSLTIAYRQAPFFDEIADLLEEAYIKRHWTFLKDLNHWYIEKIVALLNVKTKIRDVGEFKLEGDRVGRLLSLLVQVGATEYVTGPSAEDYLRDFQHLFVEHNIVLTYKSYDHYPSYRQLRAPFEPAVSIIDLLANVGIKAAPNYIWVST